MVTNHTNLIKRKEAERVIVQPREPDVGVKTSRQQAPTAKPGQTDAFNENKMPGSVNHGDQLYALAEPSQCINSAQLWMRRQICSV